MRFRWAAGQFIHADSAARAWSPRADGRKFGSIGEFGGGDWRLTLGIGERLFGNTMWFGSSHGAYLYYAEGRRWGCYFANGAGIRPHRSGGAPLLAVAFPLRLMAISP